MSSITITLFALRRRATSLVIYQAAHLPAPGDIICINGWRYRVLEREQTMSKDDFDDGTGGWYETWDLMVRKEE